MASILREGFKTAGIIFSVIVSSSSFALSIFNFYYDHLKTSEAVDAFVTNSSTNLDKMWNLEGMTFYILLVNKGDSSVTVSALWFGFDIGVPGCTMSKTASKRDEDDFITPILLPPKQASEITPRFKIENLPKWEPFNCLARDIRFIPEGQNPPKEPPPPPPVIVEQMSIMLEFTTIGTNYGVQKMEIPLGTVHLGNTTSGKMNAFQTDSFHALLPIREDPPLLKALWNSLFD